MAAEAEAGATPEPPKGSKLKLILIILVPLLLIGGGVGGAFMMGLIGGKSGVEVAANPGAMPGDHDDHGDAGDHGGSRDHAAEAHADLAAGGAHAKDTTTVLFVELPDILVNLPGTGKRTRFLKLKLALEVEDEKAAGRIGQLTPRILDSFQIYLRAMDPGELNGSAGLYKLKEDLMARVNHAISPSRVSNVLFKEMLVQ
ncbi:MAG: flagellar basal body-associated FliL family protein [Geminicoccaceae bacterium]